MIGLGEIGLPIFKILSKNFPTSGYDLDSKIMKKIKNKKLDDSPIDLIHICLPFSKSFESIVLSYSKKFPSKVLVIHSNIILELLKNYNRNLQFQLFTALLVVFIKE